MGEPTEMDLIKSQIHDMAEKSDKRMDRLEELLTKLASTSSNANESPSLDENGNPIQKKVTNTHLKMKTQINLDIFITMLLMFNIRM